ncbi:ABC transporter permease [Metasolibacillus meyeri]|uniref:Putative hemin transport system permease protein HrtB n=1 Tax=Metasolibacillus meyeri TaxID=1071052 RepID=A0AAW9NYW1_9BACL|nr:ABC transporter permease [Metasolibacillus meyeri]MEC1180753.1 ABC transporter permease [Metasolibacillus meyeri]
MNLAWKEIKRNKARFFIVGSIVFLISFLTLIISGLANGLSQDNAALIKNLPNGQFYMTERADGTFNMSQIPPDLQNDLLQQEGAVALSIQMGFVNDELEKQHGVAFVTSTASDLFPAVVQGEVLLDESLQEKGIQIGDRLINNQLTDALIVKGFVKEQKYSHAPVAFISQQDYQEMYRSNAMQLIFVPNAEVQTIDGLQAFSAKALLESIPSYKAEQMSLNMIVGFLIIISGMLFAIFFYMMNVQKIGLYGILKAIGLKTMKLFQIIWVQMLVITSIALLFAIALSQVFMLLAPSGMPFHLSFVTTLQLAGIFLVIGFIGATLSGLQIKKIEPLQAIQRGDG